MTIKESGYSPPWFGNERAGSDGKCCEGAVGFCFIFHARFTKRPHAIQPRIQDVVSKPLHQPLTDAIATFNQPWPPTIHREIYLQVTAGKLFEMKGLFFSNHALVSVGSCIVSPIQYHKKRKIAKILQCFFFLHHQHASCL